MKTQHLHEDQNIISEILPDSKTPWWDNHYEDTFSEEVENGYPYDMGTKIQE